MMSFEFTSSDAKIGREMQDEIEKKVLQVNKSNRPLPYFKPRATINITLSIFVTLRDCTGKILLRFRT